MKHLNSEGVAVLAAMTLPTVSHSLTEHERVKKAVDTAKKIYLEAIRVVEEHSAELDSDRN